MELVFCRERCWALTCTALLRKQLLSPGPFSRPLALVKDMLARGSHISRQSAWLAPSLAAAAVSAPRSAVATCPLRPEDEAAAVRDGVRDDEADVVNAVAATSADCGLRTETTTASEIQQHQSKHEYQVRNIQLNLKYIQTVLKENWNQLNQISALFKRCEFRYTCIADLQLTCIVNLSMSPC